MRQVSIHLLLLLAAWWLPQVVQSFTAAPPQQQAAATRRRTLPVKPLQVSQIGSRSEKATKAATTKEKLLPTTTAPPPPPLAENKIVVAPQLTAAPDDNDEDVVYRNGLLTIAFITLLFASNSPALHAAFAKVVTQPPVLLLNAACSVVALVGMVLAGPFLDDAVDKPSLLLLQDDKEDEEAKDSLNDALLLPDKSVASNPFWTFLVVGNTSSSNNLTLRAGCELGLWKFLGTVCNMYGLSQTSAGHGAFLIQLTTLFVPLAQGFLGVPIPRRIWTAIALAITGVLMFTTTTTQDVDGTTAVGSLPGDVACVAAAVLYATYDLRLFHWGKLVEPLQLITSKIITQTALSVAVLLVFAAGPSMEFLTHADTHDLVLAGCVTLWSGLAVNAVAPFLQVGGQQAVGPARAQILYASQPLWAALMSLVWLGETVGPQGVAGGTAFLGAMMLAATAELPDPDCDKDICET